MLSNVFARLLPSARPIRLCQQHLLRSLSTAEAASPESSSSATGDREKGTVKRFSKEKGYGFISKNSDGSDCFVHFKNIKLTGFKTLEQGQEVEFTVVQGEKGLEARDVSVLSTGTGRPSFFSGASNNNSTSSRFGYGGTARNQSSSAFSFGDTSSSRSRSSRQSSALDDDTSDFGSGSAGSTTGGLFSSRRARPTASDGKRETGSVKRWNEERGFGFIRRSSGGSDLFCHARSLKDGLRLLDEGQAVQFSVQQTDKGEEARDVSIFTGEMPSTEGNESAASTERVTGTVRRWLDEKGYGFLQRDNGEPDVFVHARNLPEGTTSLEEGQAVEFTVTSGGKGDVAQNVTVRAQA